MAEAASFGLAEATQLTPSFQAEQRSWDFAGKKSSPCTYSKTNNCWHQLVLRAKMYMPGHEESTT
jgi:hypothetical protein